MKNEETHEGIVEEKGSTQRVETLETEALVLPSKSLLAQLVDGDVDPDKALEKLDKVIEFKKKILFRAIKATVLADWLDIEGRPWPRGGAAHRIKSQLGVRVANQEIVREDFEDEVGKYYMYTASGDFSLPGLIDDPTPVIGTCSSRDQFFSIKHGRARPVTEIDPGSIKKAAQTNMITLGVFKVLGLHGLSWVDLEDLGFKAADAQRVDMYKGKRRPAPSSAKEDRKRETKPAEPAPSTQEGEGPHEDEARRKEVKAEVGKLIREITLSDDQSTNKKKFKELAGISWKEFTELPLEEMNPIMVKMRMRRDKKKSDDPEDATEDPGNADLPF